MAFTVHLQRNDVVVKSESFWTFQEAKNFVAEQLGQLSADLAVIVEYDDDGNEVRTHRIDQFHV